MSTVSVRKKFNLYIHRYVRTRSYEHYLTNKDTLPWEMELSAYLFDENPVFPLAHGDRRGHWGVLLYEAATWDNRDQQGDRQ